VGSYTAARTFDQLLALCHRTDIALKHHVEAFMATAEELQQTIDDLGVSLEQAKVRTMEDINALEAQIAALEAGQAITQEQIDSMDAQLQSMKSNVEGFDPIPSDTAPDQGLPEAPVQPDQSLPGPQPEVDPGDVPYVDPRS
jgi:seryl-tRNA synthetase